MFIVCCLNFREENASPNVYIIETITKGLEMPDNQTRRLLDKINEATARLEVVRDILSVETHPQYRKRYAMEAGRIKSRIAAYRHKIKYAR